MDQELIEQMELVFRLQNKLTMEINILSEIVVKYVTKDNEVKAEVE